MTSIAVHPQPGSRIKAITSAGCALAERRHGLTQQFGGTVGPAAFSRPEAVVTIDRVYIPAVQPLERLLRMGLRLGDGHDVAIIRDGAYVVPF